MPPDLTSGSRTWQKVKGVAFSFVVPFFFWFFVLTKPIWRYVHPTMYNKLQSYNMDVSAVIKLTKKWIGEIGTIVSGAELMRGDTLPTDEFTVFTVDGGGKPCSLSRIVDAAKYTVINFGSCT